MQNQSLRFRIAAGTPAGFALPDDCRLTPVSLFSHLKPLGSELDFEHLYAIIPKGGRECWEMQNQSLRSRIAAGTPAGFALPDACRLTPVSFFSRRGLFPCA
jgi:hypothetical protein